MLCKVLSLALHNLLEDRSKQTTWHVSTLNVDLRGSPFANHCSKPFEILTSSTWLMIPVCGAYGGLYPNLSRINFLGPSFFRNKFPFPKKGTTPRRTWYTKKSQNQFWDHGGKHLWIKFQWPRSCLSLWKSPTNSAPRNSTLFCGCNPSVAEYFSTGQPPWTLKIPKLGLNKFRRGIVFFGHRVRKKILPARTRLLMLLLLGNWKQGGSPGGNPAPITPTTSGEISCERFAKSWILLCTTC